MAALGLWSVWPRLAVLALALPMYGCGGGGGAASETTSSEALRITDASVPCAAAGHPYAAQLVAVGGTPPYAWAVVPGAGRPPDGLVLDASGQLAGTAALEGYASFTARVTDAVGATRTAAVAVPVQRLDVEADPLDESGLLLPGTSCNLTALAGGASVAFAIVSDPTGGSLDDAAPALGRVTFRAGPGSGRIVLRAMRSQGAELEFDLPVRLDPFREMTARFGTTDVWWPRFDARDDPGTPFANDLDDALATVGLRDPLSFDALGTRADRLARTYVVRQIFRRMNRAFLNAEDGAAAPEGLPISLCYLDPTDATHAAPPVGERSLPVPGGFNAIAFHYGFEANYYAGSYGFPDPGNAYLDNFDGRNPSNAMGVHVQAAATEVGSWGTLLAATPIDAGDEARLEAMLLDAPLLGDPRTDQILRTADGIANVLGLWGAHAIGHGIGLYHPTGGPPTIMGGDWPAGTNEGLVGTATFGAGEIDTLRAALPGPGR